MSEEDLMIADDAELLDGWNRRSTRSDALKRFITSPRGKIVVALSTLCVGMGLAYSIMHKPQQEVIRENHVGAPLQNQMYSHCLISTNKASESAPRPAPIATFVRTGHCDKEGRILYFVPDAEILTTEDGKCLVPLSPDKEGALITIQECNKDGNPRPGSQWRFGGSKNEQLINDLDMCMDLEHQHSHGFMIQWHCKNIHQYKAANQLFNFYTGH